MTRKKPPKDRLTAKDVALWKAMTEDVKRADGASYVDAPDDDRPVDQAVFMPDVRPVILPKAKARADKTGTELDGRTAEKLRKGQIRPESRIDLHGMAQDNAYAALEAFIMQSYARGLRCVLVITGKGKTGMQTDDTDWLAPTRGVLKVRVPEWLRTGEMGRVVLRAQESQPKDGGDGALYIYLRRG